MFTPKALLLDLDDTLFDERRYVESGFRAVAGFLERERDLPADYSYPSMLAFLELEGRGRIFDRVIERFEIRQADGLVDQCISTYRAHSPDIDLYEGVGTLLDSLAPRYSMALVTNGAPEMQAKKIKSLDVGKYFDSIVFCDGLGTPKPAPEGLYAALSDLQVSSGDALFVGDNPQTDGAAAAAAGVDFVRIRTPRFAEVHSNAPELGEFSKLASLLKSG